MNSVLASRHDRSMLDRGTDLGWIVVAAAIGAATTIASWPARHPALGILAAAAGTLACVSLGMRRARPAAVAAFVITVAAFSPMASAAAILAIASAATMSGARTYALLSAYLVCVVAIDAALALTHPGVASNRLYALLPVLPAVVMGLLARVQDARRPARGHRARRRRHPGGRPRGAGRVARDRQPAARAGGRRRARSLQRAGWAAAADADGHPPPDRGVARGGDAGRVRAPGRSSRGGRRRHRPHCLPRRPGGVDERAQARADQRGGGAHRMRRDRRALRQRPHPSAGRRVPRRRGRSARGGAVPGSGTGLIGLGERVELAGGRLAHGRTAGGGYALRATLPLAA